MRRNDVPEQHVLGEIELPEDALHHRRRRLRGTAAGELPLGREGEARDPRAAVPRGLADEQQRRFGTIAQVRHEALAEQPGARSLGVLVEGLADSRTGELVDEDSGVHLPILAPAVEWKARYGELGQPG
jgi:hypothetical protein